ncbi:unnamed protein product [Dibothriocephalus latus]|uniref:Tr-type G domain-containing protein n=1 Tax=Dibothriocephalus latus TaxID=60516 RepID=A0A3P6QSI1_DIBLA|nr:unnamed protein product [Dibothriocephalus latus]
MGENCQLRAGRRQQWTWLEYVISFLPYVVPFVMYPFITPILHSKTGQTHAMGEVDRGDTVTDFLEEERERGISIMSATACFPWQRHSVHLIDTPGHVDFTLEVERSLAVVDSALTIIDACKGVETQTRTVW